VIIGWVVAAGYVVFLLVATQRVRTRRPSLADYPPAPPARLVSIVVPARNESANIEPCVRSMLANRYDRLEIVVVDDRSRDATAALVESLAETPEAAGRVRLVRGSDPPPDWFGKQWALIQGYRAARGELLVFADADTRHGPELVARAVGALDRERVDLVSVIPQQELGSFWERLVQPHVFFVLGARVGDVRRINRTRVAWDAIANGQFILTPRPAYEGVGTHERVKDTVVDDLALAQAYVAEGKDIFLAHAQPFMRTRMYRSFGEIVAGWTKNLALGAPRMLPPVPWLRRIAPWIMWLPALAWLAPPVVWALTGWPFALVATLASLALWAAVYREEGVGVGYALLYPVAAAVVMYIVLRSAVRGQRVEWKGRVYGG
jgi:chlorobactene glucosyltransferase